MEILPLKSRHLPAAADLFVHNFSALRQDVPALPPTLEDGQTVANKIAEVVQVNPGLVAFEAGQLVGYLTWMLVDDFRGAGRRAAYGPEWAHAALPGWQTVAYRQLYRSAGIHWAAQGCQVHAITLLANDQLALQTWFWSGFGMAVVDAVRSLQPLELRAPTRFLIRQAGTADAAALSHLDQEHCHYYTQSPVFMPLRASWTVEEFRQFVEKPGNSVWMALEGDLPVGFLRLDGDENDGADALTSAGTVKINAAFVQPLYRGLGASRAMLCAALRHHAALGKTCCAVDFEAFNPEAAGFWLRYFQPACLYLMRLPESVPA